ncbi:MAG: cobalamin-binding protein [Candidatus Omnitrophica bacterium]|nr:cobalamin-binding protein [Candidatus Omnitrophota bacterium]
MNLARQTKLLFLSFLALLQAVFANAESAEKIVSLAPSITESLYQLQKDKALVGVTSYCNYPEEAKTKEVIGTLINPNIEKIYSLSPDLVLTIKGSNRPQTIAKLKHLGLRVVVFEECDSFSDIRKNFIRLGRIVGEPEKAKKIIQNVKTKKDSIAKKVKGLHPVSTFLEINARPLVSANNKAFVSEFIKYGGGVNIFAYAPVKYPRISREEVLRKNPEAIILVTMGDVTEKEKQYWQKFTDLKAVKTDRIYIINADKFCRPTPLTFLNGLQKVAKLLHPEAFKKKRDNE